VNVNRSSSRVYRGWTALTLVSLVWALAPVNKALCGDRRSVVAIPEKAFEFGSVSEGAVVEHDFEIRNEGSADLQIERIAPSCGCTAATVTAPLVGPGKSEKIRVKFDTAGFSGNKFKQIHVFTSDKDHSDIVFTLRGTIISEIKVEPTVLDFGDVAKSSSVGARRKEFTVSLEQDSDLRIARASSSSQSVQVTEVSRRNRSVSYQVDLLPTMRRGDLRERVVVRFVGDKKPALNIPVVARVVGDVTLSPAVVSFGVISGEQAAEKRIQWRTTALNPIRITKVRSSHSAISAELVEIQPGRQGVLVVRVDPGRFVTQLKETITLSTDAKEDPELVLPVYAVKPPN
jgi:hypothetical protein